MHLFRSVRARVTLGALLVVGIALGAGAVGTVVILGQLLTQGVAAAVEQDLETIGEQLEDRPVDVGDLDGEVLVRLQGGGRRDGEGPRFNDEDAATLPVVPEDSVVRLMIDDEPYLAASEETDVGMLTVARSIENVDDATATASLVLAVAVPLLLIVIGIVVWVVATRALAPVERMRRQVDGIDGTALDRRVDAGRDDELGALAATMNRMLERIEEAQKTQRRFVSDASHELRSPLATIRQHAEVAVTHPASTSVQDLGGVVLDEGRRMQDLVEGLLLLARLDEHGGHGQVRGPVDMDDLALAEGRRLRGMGVVVDGHGIGAGRVIGSEVLLARALRNLVDNAVRHASTTVTLRVVTERAWVRIEVEDDGDGVPEERREQIFERFARLDEARARDEGGSGLGLAIVREIARAHGGDVTVSAGREGGARFTLALPAGS
ncbi:cell wall metabolism sensor histidine kinase WalK [Microbacterium sp. SD291]|uniref:sensor histidine kinase n=1 Tax=Microbacterium sp. SD291 TaxID=2782007 RepID=UPI001A968CBF|nr:HAMP domain-containing sensor histidine kinase [Microbacterium sp. SD291]MBO0981195.1 HAMP domain-containing histidine kinase [Microbacterium sp. SD291]